MTVYRLVGSDTIIINARTFSDFGHGEVGKITFATDIATVKTGKTKNGIIASNASGDQATLELRLLRGGADDTDLNTLLLSYKTDPISFVLLAGSLAKKLGQGDGNVTTDLFTLSGGVFTKNPEVISNVEGDVEQAIVLYTIQFVSATRTIV